MCFLLDPPCPLPMLSRAVKYVFSFYGHLFVMYINGIVLILHASHVSPSAPFRIAIRPTLLLQLSGSQLDTVLPYQGQFAMS